MKTILLLLISFSGYSQLPEKQLRIVAYKDINSERVICEGCIIAVEGDSLHIKAATTETFYIKDRLKSHGKNFYVLEGGFFMLEKLYAILQIGAKDTRYSLKRSKAL